MVLDENEDWGEAEGKTEAGSFLRLFSSLLKKVGGVDEKVLLRFVAVFAARLSTLEEAAALIVSTSSTDDVATNAFFRGSAGNGGGDEVGCRVACALVGDVGTDLMPSCTGISAPLRDSLIKVSKPIL